MSYDTTQLITIEIHRIDESNFIQVEAIYLQSLTTVPSSFSTDCSCLMTKDNLIGIEFIVVYRFHTSLNS
jgi:hypothetical protein